LSDVSIAGYVLPGITVGQAEAETIMGYYFDGDALAPPGRLGSRGPVGDRLGKRLIRLFYRQQTRGLGPRHSASTRCGAQRGRAHMIRQIRNENDIVLAEAEVNGIEFSAQLLDSLELWHQTVPFHFLVWEMALPLPAQVILYI